MAVDIGPKIGIDGEAEFRQQIKQLTEQVKTFGSELAAAASDMDVNGKSEETLTRKSEVLTRAIEAQEKKLDELKKGLEASSREFGENDTKTLKWAQAVNNATTKLNQLKTEAQKNEQEINDLGESFDEAGDSASIFGDVLAGSLSADVIKNTISQIIDLVGQLGEAIIGFAQDTENANKKATAYFGETGAAAEQTEQVIQDVFAGGMGESIEEVADAVITVKKNLDDLSQSDLTNLTNQAMTLDSLYGIDMNETLRGVNSLMEQFGLDAQTAMDYIVTGTRNGLDKTNELGDNLSEYAGKFAQAGYSAEEYFQLLNNGLDGGAYNLDKVNDAINEVTTRLADGTLGDEIKSYSRETQTLFKEWQNGGASQKQVIDSIVSDIANAESQQEALTMAATAFGTMAEDGNLKFIESLTSVGDAYTDVTGKSQELVEATTTNQQTMTAAMRGLQEQFLPVGEALTGIIATLVTGFTQLASGIDLTGFAETITAIFTNLVSIFRQVSSGQITVTQGFTQILNSASTVLSGVAQSIISALPELITTGIEMGSALLDGWLQEIPKFIEQGVQLVSELVQTMLQNAPQFLEAGVNFIQTLIQGIVDMLPTLLQQAPVLIGNLVTGLLENLPQILETGIKLIGELIAGLISAIPNIIAAVPQVISAIIDTITGTDWISVGGNIIQGLIDGLIGGISAIADAAASVGEAAINSIKSVLGIASPSRVFRDEVGRQITAGIAEGILADKKYAKKSVEEVGSAIISAAQTQLDNYKVYNNMTLAEEAAFWNEMRQKVQEGTQARIDADKKYLDAKKQLDDQLMNIEKNYKDNVSKVYKDLSDNIEDAWENYREQVESIKDSIKSQLNLFEEFDYSTEQTTTDLINNLQSQVEGMTVWRDSLDKLSRRGLPQGLMDELEDMGVSAAGQIKLLSEMTDDELSQYISLWASRDSLAAEAAKEQSEPLLKETREQIAEMREAAKEELDAYQDQFVESMESIGVALIQPLEQIKNALIQSYVDTVGTVADTVDQQANDSTNQEKYAQIAENMIQASSNLPDSFYTLGQQTVDGIINGLKSQSSQLYNTMEQIVNGLVAAAQSTLQIHSPSRVMQNLIGKNIVEGLAEGMSKYQGIAVNAANRLYGDVLGSFSQPGSANGTAMAYNNLANQLANMKIVLSDGTLVGKLTPQIDTALGGYTKIKERYYT